MFEKFGEFDSVEELNLAAEGLKKEGDMESIRALAKENGLDPEDAEDYINGMVGELATPLTAALGKLKLEKDELKIQGIMEDWYTEVVSGCTTEEKISVAVRMKNKKLKEVMSLLLAKGFNDKVQVSEQIVSITTINHNGKKEKMRGPIYLGMPNRTEVKNIVREYYLG